VFKWTKKLTHGSDFRVYKYKDAVYQGQVNEKGQRHGKGVMLYDGGRLYEGHWANDRREGHGYEKYDNSNIFIGYFKNGKAHGKGLYTWANGEYYEGDWNMGQKHG
jgi:hypothetical protein